MNRFNNIVLNIPHSSLNGVFGEYGKWNANPYFMKECVLKHTDWYTDMLFATKNEKVKSVIFPYSRFVCDAERLVDDPKESEGQGIIYTHFGNYKRGDLTEEEKAYILELRTEHLNRLTEALEENGSLIIDCHSFNGGIDECQICIGYNDDDTYDGEAVELVKKIFKKYNYSVSLNTPYSNSISPSTDKKYKSLMIEVNKKIYLYDDNQLCYNKFHWMKWYACMNKIYEELLKLKL